MKKPSFIKRFFSFLLRVCVVLALMAVIAVGSFEGVTYYLTGSFTSVKSRKTLQTLLSIIRIWRIHWYLFMMRIPIRIIQA